ncbi:MAG: hypothetical protein R2724_15050 [Bryobacterales bacterium]
MPQRYKWYAVIFVVVVVLTAVLFVADLTDGPDPAQTAVPMEKNPDYKPSQQSDTPMAEEGGPYR